MAYRFVDGVGLRTRYVPEPPLVVDVGADGLVLLELVFPYELVELGAGCTRLRFEGVLEYRWIASDQQYFPSNPDDYEFALIEIVDSGMIAQMLDQPSFSEASPVGGRVESAAEKQARHFRIGFDDYGDFDVVCLGLSLEHFRGDLLDE